MQLSVVITTYNQPAWLELVLWGYSAQVQPPHEIIVADDGSDERTARVIDRLRAALPCPLVHVWHEDDGFRKCTILNRAIEASSGDALLFTDGDCIPRADLVAVHVSLLRPKRFLSGGYVKLPAQVSAAITKESVISGDATRYAWLRAAGADRTRALNRLRMSSRVGSVLDRITTTRASFNGHNATAWREDLVRANGFDERMGWGGLDRELGERLENAGVRGLQVRHRAHVVHLHHERGYLKLDVLQANRRIRDETRALKRTRAVVGMDAARGMSAPSAVVR